MQEQQNPAFVFVKMCLEVNLGFLFKRGLLAHGISTNEQNHDFKGNCNVRIGLARLDVAECKPGCRMEPDRTITCRLRIET